MGRLFHGNACGFTIIQSDAHSQPTGWMAVMVPYTLRLKTTLHSLVSAVRAGGHIYDDDSTASQSKV